MDLAPPQGVGWTALVAAYARAQESRRPDPLFDDPLARAVIAGLTPDRLADDDLPPVGPATDDGSSEMWANWGSYLVVRTPFYDAHVTAAVAAGCSQVVLLAAGFDGRARRLGLPSGTSVFEIDTAPVLDYKQTAMEESGIAGAAHGVRRRTVAADLRDDWSAALLAAGHDPSSPTVWVAEGLLMYLDGEQCARLLTEITARSAPGSRVVTEWFERNPAGEPSLVGYPDEGQRRAGELAGSLFGSGPDLPPRPWLEAQGWDVLEIDEVGARHVRHHRHVPWAFDTAHPLGLRVHLVAGALPARPVLP